jgi:hypothetical protein
VFLKRPRSSSSIILQARRPRARALVTVYARSCWVVRPAVTAPAQERAPVCASEWLAPRRVPQTGRASPDRGGAAAPCRAIRDLVAVCSCSSKQSKMCCSSLSTDSLICAGGAGGGAGRGEVWWRKGLRACGHAVEEVVGLRLDAGLGAWRMYHHHPCHLRAVVVALQVLRSAVTATAAAAAATAAAAAVLAGHQQKIPS